MARLWDRYNKEMVAQLGSKLNRKNRLSLPRLQKIVVNMGVGKALQDKNRMEQSAEQLTQITGQRAQVGAILEHSAGLVLIETASGALQLPIGTRL